MNGTHVQTDPRAASADATPARIDAPLAAWHAHLAEGRLMLQRCDSCSRCVFYPRVICPHCAGERLSWSACVGDGTVYSTTVVARRAEQGGPYNVALIDLDEGVRLMSRVDGVAPDAVAIGQRVRYAIDRSGDAATLVFRPA